MNGVLRNKFFLILVGVLLTSFLVGVAYFFATRKSEPVYVSKIDRIMFDKKNKAPQFVITLPDYAEKIFKEDEIVEKTVVPTPQETQEKVELDSVAAAISLLEKMPVLAKLQPVLNPRPLPQIELLEAMVDENSLPKISDDGKKPWIEYGVEEPVLPNFYKVGIVIKGLGLEGASTMAAIEAMPTNVSLSFSPYGRNLSKIIKKSRTLGHETYIDLLLSSKNFLKSDSGPLSMSVTDSKEANLAKIKKSLRATQAPVGGVVINSGIANADTQEQLEAFLDYFKSIGLLVIDATKEDGVDAVKTEGLPRMKADIVIEDRYTKANIEKKLKAAEEIAKEKGIVLIAVEAKPVVLHAINDWVGTFSPQLDYELIKGQEIEKPFALVPISNLVVE